MSVKRAGAYANAVGPKPRVLCKIKVAGIIAGADKVAGSGTTGVACWAIGIIGGRRIGKGAARGTLVCAAEILFSGTATAGGLTPTIGATAGPFISLLWTRNINWLLTALALGRISTSGSSGAVASGTAVSTLMNKESQQMHSVRSCKAI